MKSLLRTAARLKETEKHAAADRANLQQEIDNLQDALARAQQDVEAEKAARANGQSELRAAYADLDNLGDQLKRFQREALAERQRIEAELEMARKAAADDRNQLLVKIMCADLLSPCRRARFPICSLANQIARVVLSGVDRMDSKFC